jgi:rhodanese-related sulfurtransferase
MVAQVRPADLSRWIQSVCEKGAPLVLDVREPSEQQVASIQANGFELHSIPMGVVPLRLHELDPDQPIACLCHHGGRSMQVAQFLKSHGYQTVANIAGGIDAWSIEIDASVARY